MTTIAAPAIPKVAAVPRKGLAGMALVLLFWSFGPALSKRVGTPPLVTVFYRMWLAAIFHWALALALQRAPDWATLKRTALPGALFAGNIVAFFYALHHASVANVTLISSLQPVVVLFVAGPLFGEKLKRWDVGWTIVALVGAVVAVLGSNNSHNSKTHTTAFGVVLSMVSLMTFTGYFFLSKRASAAGATQQALPPITYMAGVLTASAIVVTPISLIGSKSGQMTDIHPRDVVWILLVVAVPSAGHLLMSWTHRYVPVSVSSLALLIQPVSAALAAWAINHQPVVVAQAVGAAIVITALAAVVSRRQAAAPVAAPVSARA